MTMTLAELARKADAADYLMGLAAIDFKDAAGFGGAPSARAIDRLRRVQELISEIMPVAERSMRPLSGPPPHRQHLWVTPDPATDPVRCQTCGCLAGVEAAQACEGSPVP